jgi:hypothetical protein
MVSQIVDRIPHKNLALEPYSHGIVLTARSVLVVQLVGRQPRIFLTNVNEASAKRNRTESTLKNSLMV